MSTATGVFSSVQTKWIFVVKPPRERPSASSASSSFFSRRRSVDAPVLCCYPPTSVWLRPMDYPSEASRKVGPRRRPSANVSIVEKPHSNGRIPQVNRAKECRCVPDKEGPPKRADRQVQAWRLLEYAWLFPPEVSSSPKLHP